MRWFAVGICLAGVVGAAAAEEAPSSQAERQRIAEQRRVAESQYTAREAECRQRFVVTSCIDKARADRRQSLDNLHQQEIALDEVERQQRTAEHRRRQDAKIREELARPVPEPSAPRQPKPVLPRPAHAPQAAASKPSAAERSADEQRSREQFEARKREAEAHRVEIEKRNKERVAKRGAARPLPLPGAASAP